MKWTEKSVDKYLETITPEMIKEAFEEYGFTMEYKEEEKNANDTIRTIETTR